jgi:putative phage-type endonuclease
MSAAALEPGGDEWLKLVTASKVPAILGLSPWESPFSLYHRMNGTAPAKEATPQTERGHYLEPAIVQWWSDQHPEFDVTPTPGLYFAKENARHAASPDAALRLVPARNPRIEGVLEVKTAARADEWGSPGTDEIPIYYRAQVLWQAYVLDVPRVHVAVLTGGLEFREYVVERDEADLAVIHEAVAVFLTSLDAGTPPDLDSSAATYEVMRQLHPDIDRDLDVDVEPEIAQGWLDARTALAEAEAATRFYGSALMDELGNARRGLLDGVAFVRREAKKGGTPYLKAINVKETA